MSVLRSLLTPSAKSAVIALVLGNIALATGPLLVRLTDVGPVAAGFWRIALATPMLLAFSIALGGTKSISAAKGLGWILVIAGIAFAADLASWHIGILNTTLANSTLFGNSATLLFPIYGFFAARMWPTKMQGIALLLAAAGAGLLLGRSASLSAANLKGDLLCLFAGVVYAVYFVLMAKARERLAPMSALALSSIASVPPLLLMAIAMGEQIMPTNWGPVFILALVSQVIGQGCMIYALGHLSPLVIGVALLIQPIVAAALGWIVFDERLATADIIGAVLVGAALVMVRSSEVASQPEKPKSV